MVVKILKLISWIGGLSAEILAYITKHPAPITFDSKGSKAPVDGNSTKSADAPAD